LDDREHFSPARTGGANDPKTHSGLPRPFKVLTLSCDHLALPAGAFSVRG
jgi:hypothetical protein